MDEVAAAEVASEAEIEETEEVDVEAEVALEVGTGETEEVAEDAAKEVPDPVTRDLATGLVRVLAVGTQTLPGETPAINVNLLELTVVVVVAEDSVVDAVEGVVAVVDSAGIDEAVADSVETGVVAAEDR